MVCLAVTWVVEHERHRAKAIEYFQKLTEGSRREPGCLLYIVHESTEDPLRFFIYEQYQDQAALLAHGQTPHFVEFALDGLAKIGRRQERLVCVPIC